MAQAANKNGARVHKPVGTDVSTARRVSRLRRHNRLRKRVAGTPERPRMVVKRSSRHIHVDRESTRLNSSHANISHPVLRLPQPHPHRPPPPPLPSSAHPPP